MSDSLRTSMFGRHAAGDALCATEPIRCRRNERPVNVLAIYVANEHVQSLIEASVEWSLAHALPAGPSLRDRIASAAAGLRRLAGNPTTSVGVLPKLEDYPHRS
jgi:hypothetical protein